jgi:UTP--glucose-1-phosphate uridylyltransferase
MIKAFDRLQASIAAVIEVPKTETNKYGIVDAGKMTNGVVSVKGLVEKPKPEEAPSNLAIIGRYILTPKIFEFLDRKQRGAGNEIQLTDAMSMLLEYESIFGFRFKGRRFDCGDKAGFQLANIAFAMESPEIREKLIPFLKEIVNGNSADPHKSKP